MKSIRRAIRGNQAYHSNLLGKEFDGLVEDATEKGLSRPDEEANRNVILAINDPNTGMELTPHKISQELRKQLRSMHSQKQWLTMVLIRDVLAECQSHVQPVLLEILEAVSVIAAMDTRTSNQALRNAKQVAMEILSSHGTVGNQAFRRGTGVGVSHQRSASTHATPAQKEPEWSLGFVQEYDASCQNHCEVLRGLITGGEQHEMTTGLIQDLIGEIKQMRKVFVKAVERLSNHSGSEVENGIAKALGDIDAIDKTIELHEKAKAGESISELSFRDMASIRRESSRSLDLGQRGVDKTDETTPQPRRSHSTDLIGLDALEEGLRQPTQPTQPTQQTETDDPFQLLANTPTNASSSQADPNGNPFSFPF